MSLSNVMEHVHPSHRMSSSNGGCLTNKQVADVFCSNEQHHLACMLTISESLSNRSSSFRPQQEQNLLILHDGPRACVRKEYINQGVVRADPESYVQRYGAELGTWNTSSQHAHLVSEASRAVPPPAGASSDHYQEHDYRYGSDRYERALSPCNPSSTWERVRAPSPLPRCSSYQQTTSCYEPSYSYCRDLSYDCDYGPRRCYDDCYPRRDNCLTMTDVSSSWNRYCRPSDYDCLPSSHDSYCSPSQPRTIRVCSDDEFRRVLCDLTNGHVSSALRAC